MHSAGSSSWKVGQLGEVGMDTTLFQRLLSELPPEKHKMESMLVVRKNRLVFEHYFHGATETTLHDLRSATKSIIALLTGIAIDKGFFSSVEDSLFKYLPAYFENNQHFEKRGIRLQHLLNMNTGLACNDWDKNSPGQEDRVYKKKDWIDYLLNLPMYYEPGDTSLYCTGGVMLLAAAIESASGMAIDQFANAFLFHPMGIDSVFWQHTNKKEVMSAGKRLSLRPRDMARIGQLMINEGECDGKQLVSNSWIAECMKAQAKIYHVDYGNLWWKIPLATTSSKKYEFIAAMGNGGQYILVQPALQLVVVFTGHAYNEELDKLPFTVVNKVILPSLYKTD